MVNIPTPSDAAMAYTARDNPVTRFMDYLTEDANKSLLDKFLLALSSAGLLTFQCPHGPLTLSIQCLGLGAAVASYFRNRDGGRFRELAAAVTEHHFVTTATAHDDGIRRGVDQAYATAAAENEVLQQELDKTRAELSQWEQSRDQLLQLQSSLELREKQLQLTADRETLNVEQQWAKLQGTIDQQQRAIAQLEGQLGEAMGVIETQAGQSQMAIAEALENQETRHRAAVAELNNQIEKLGAAREVALQRARLDVELPEVVEQIPEKLGPVIIAGQQGAGKGTQTIALLEKLGKQYGGLNVFVLDPSEDDGWGRAGITPYSADARDAYFGLMYSAIEGAKANRLHRNHPGFDRQGLMVFVVDETPSVFDGVPKQQGEAWNQIIRRVNRQGAKRGIFCIFLSQGFQVQSLTSNKIRVMAQDDMMNTSIILLNDLCEAYTKYPGGCDFREGDRERYETQAGMYRAAIATTNNGARSLSLCKHSSHYGLDLSTGTPSRPITPPTLSPYPSWLPDSESDHYYELQDRLKFLVEAGLTGQFRDGVETDRETQRNSGETAGKLRGRNGIEALRDVYPEDSPLSVETDNPQNPDLAAWLETDKISTKEGLLIGNCHRQGLSQKKTVLEIYNRKPGRSKTYQRAASKVRTVYKELSRV